MPPPAVPAPLGAADPWRLEVLVVTPRWSSAERQAVARDAARGRLLRSWTGCYVERAAYEPLTVESRHVVRMRALAGSASGPVVFSHWSAAVLHRLPVLRDRLALMHLATPDDGTRHRRGAVTHLAPLDDSDCVGIGGLRVTALGRTVVDLAGAARFEEGVMAADAVLRRGEPRALLEDALGAAGPRRASRRPREVVAFAHPGGESPAESRTRVNAYRIGVEVPELQRRVPLGRGQAAFLDTYFPGADAALEVDGDAKYLDPVLAPDGAAAVVLAEKRREDEVRTRVRALGRIGWAESGDAVLLRPVLARIGVPALQRPPAFEAWCEAARAAVPRLPPRVWGWL